MDCIKEKIRKITREDKEMVYFYRNLSVWVALSINNICYFYLRFYQLVTFVTLKA